jgi:predicted RNase H-like nuclease (RuvC/YqgF family)
MSKAVEASSLDLDQLRTQSENIRSVLQSSTEQVSLLEEQNKQLSDKNSELQHTIQGLAMEIETLQSESHSKEKQCEELLKVQQVNSTLRSDIENLRNKEEEKDTLLGEYIQVGHFLFRVYEILISHIGN